MSSIHSTSKSLRSAVAPGDSAGYARFIDQQVEKTGTQVKLVDVCSSLSVLGAGVLSYLFLAIVADHWIVPLGSVGRWTALIVLVCGVGWYVATRVLPVILGRVNPLFAARAIEHSEPSLKNSLLNFLLFRSDRAGVRATVYHALEQRAAADLQQVPVDLAVDRSRLIKLGYFLAGVLAVCAAYTILAPKSPFRSMARIMAPWADIDRPSRVRIEGVAPGNVEVFQGDQIAVFADVYDLRREEPVTLHYDGLDERLGRQSTAMQPGTGNLRFESALPLDDDGFQRDVMYWIEAGDACTATYQVRVIPAPVMLVESVEYEYPRYTRRAKRTVERQGDIRAVEGTRVTVRARANQPIAAAVLEFDPPGSSAEQTTDRAHRLYRGPLATSASRIEMEFDGQEAWCSFVCEMDEPRTGAKHRTYQLRFATASGHRNPQPVLHRIEVLADLPPEIEILAPTPDRVEVPEDGRQKIEIRAVDPDYGLTTIRLKAATADQQVLKHELLQDSTGRIGQELVSYDFAPRTLGLRAGTEVECWAVAEDNRAAPLTGLPEPNTTQSRRLTLVVTEPESRLPTAEQDQPEEGQPDQDASAQQSDDMGDATSGGDRQADDGQQDGGQEDGKPQDGETQDGETQDGGTQEGGSPPSSDDGQASQPDGTGGQADASAGESGADSPQTGGPMQDGETSESAGGAEPSQHGADDASGQPGTGETREAGREGQDMAARNGEAGDADARAGQGDGEGQSSEPLHDGEAFERALEHLRQAAKEGRDQEAASRGADESQTTDQGDQPSTDSQASNASPMADESGDARQPDSKSDGQPQPAADAGQADGREDQPSPDDVPDPGGQPQEASPSGEPGLPSGDPQGQMPQETSAESGEPTEPGQNEGRQSGAGQPDEDGSSSVGGQDPEGLSKKEAASGDESRPGEEPQTPSTSRKASASKGDSGGDQSGGGAQGGGQSGDQPGNDSPGGTTPGDEGAGAAQESGPGEPASRPGDQQQSPEPTGRSGEEPGDGSRSKPASEGEAGAGDPAKEPSTDPPGETPQQPSGKTSPQSGPGLPRGGGDPGSAELGGAAGDGEVPPGEQPNLEYARKATDMVLEYLKDQESRPDEDLLNKLGWTQDDLQEFVRRWSELKQAANEDQRARRDLDDALRSLGLRPGTAAPRRTEMRPDTRGIEVNPGTRSNPPPSYRELFDAYRRGTGRTGAQPDRER